MTTSAINPSVPAPLRFYQAVAIKRICLNSGFVESGASMFVAKWQGLYVIAKDAANFFIVSEAQASEYVRTERDEKNKLKRATNAPTIVPTGPGFEWTVECGSTCPDGCDETVMDRRVVTNKEEALAQAAQWDGTRVRESHHFLRIRGPGFYEIKRPTPRPAPVVVPPPPVRNYTPARFAPTMDDFSRSHIHYYNRTGHYDRATELRERRGMALQHPHSHTSQYEHEDASHHVRYFLQNRENIEWIDWSAQNITMQDSIQMNSADLENFISEIRSSEAFRHLTPATVSVPEIPSTDSPRRDGSN
jgi:hypothetical protein